MIKPIAVVRGLDKVHRRFQSLEKRQMPYATMLAINETLNHVRDDIRGEMERVFDRPTKFTIKGVLVKYATKRNLYGETFLRDQAYKGTPPVKYLRPGVKGGERNVKRFEEALIRNGIMERGWYAMPGKGVRLNRYGNMSRGLFVKILSDIRALEGVPRLRGKIASKRLLNKYFAIKPLDYPSGRSGKNLKPGVYKRMAKGVKPVLIFTKKKPQYKKRLEYHKVAKATIRKRYAPAFRKGMKRAMATARR